MHDIQTIHQLIDCLGGDTAVANWLGISQPAVANWKVRGEIPPGWHIRLLARVVSMDLTVDPVVFGLEDSPEFGVLVGRLGNVSGAVVAA